MSAISRALLTWYGISVTMSASRSRPMSSVATLARIFRVPRPAVVVIDDARLSEHEAAGREVGTRHRSSALRRASGSDSAPSRWSRSTISVRLCGGMLVAMPTAMPDEPLISRFGTRVGKHFGLLRAVVEVRP